MASTISTSDQQQPHPFAAIHALPTTRCSSSSHQPMQVLCLGWPRTGTQSLKSALTHLGYKVYHMGDSMTLSHDHYWKLGLEAHYNNGPQQFGIQEFDKLLSSYTATADFPSSGLPLELMRAYPSAKLILNTRRDVNAWAQSMNSTILHARQHFGPSPNHDAWSVWENAEFGEADDGFERNGKRAFEDHERAVMEEARKQGREVLVYEVSEGWGPLCRFLRAEVPRDEKGEEELEYPRKDSWGEYKREQTWEN